MSLAAGAGCEGLVPSPEDVAFRYRLGEVRRVAIAHSREFHEKATLEDMVEGTLHWITEPEALRRLIESMSFYQAPTDPLRPRALCLLFFPEDAVSRTEIELDQHLDMRGEAVRHGDTLGGPDWETSQEFKVEVLRAIGSCPRCREYLGIRPPGARDPTGAAGAAPAAAAAARSREVLR